MKLASGWGEGEVGGGGELAVLEHRLGSGFGARRGTLNHEANDAAYDAETRFVFLLDRDEMK